MNGFFNLTMIEHQPVSFSGLINKKCLFQKQTRDRGFTYLVWTEAMCIQIKPVRDFWQVNELVGFTPTNTTTYKYNAKLIEGTSDAISQQGRQTTVRSNRIVTFSVGCYQPRMYRRVSHLTPAPAPPAQNAMFRFHFISSYRETDVL